MARWQDFLPRVPMYATARNQVDQECRGVSRLSPAIRLGLLRPEEIVRDTMREHILGRAEKWLQEICWRSYWKGWMEMRPQVWREWRRRVRHLRGSLPADVQSRCEAVRNGVSGVSIMDRFARELRDTGYLHNHARMWWASFWIHVEKLPWELGADFFFQHLLDADPASNTLSWRWVAGLQTPGKTYLVRRSNLEHWCAPELLDDSTGLERLEDGLVQPCPIPQDAPVPPQELAVLPAEINALSGRTGIWLHPDDTCLETSSLRVLRPVAVAAFISTDCYEKLGLSEARRGSTQRALSDGLARAGMHYGCETLLKNAACTAGALVQWAVDQKLQHIVTMAPTVGPVADVLPRLRLLLRDTGISLHCARRPWDAELFPLARAGFFPFWEKTRARLRRGQLPMQ